MDVEKSDSNPGAVHRRMLGDGGHGRKAERDGSKAEERHEKRGKKHGKGEEEMKIQVE